MVLFRKSRKLKKSRKSRKVRKSRRIQHGGGIYDDGKRQAISDYENDRGYSINSNFPGGSWSDWSRGYQDGWQERSNKYR